MGRFQKTVRMVGGGLFLFFALGCGDPAVEIADFSNLNDSETETVGDSESVSTDGPGTDGTGTDGTGTDGMCPEGDSAMCGVLAAHNSIRENVATTPSLSPFVWSDEMVESARSWAEQCIYAHSESNAAYGESLYIGTPGIYTPVSGVETWGKEVGAYDYDTNSCEEGQMCNHYKQIVWRDTTDVGCVMHRCDDGNDYFVCHYYPTGNWVGEQPY